MDEMEQLAYKNRFVRQLVQDLSNYEASDATPQVISGPDNLVLLRVSFEEWLKLTSSLFTGADICYPSESDSVRWILYRAVEQPMDLCALIAECIATSEATQEALRNFITNDPALQEWTKQTINKGSPLLPEIETLPIVQNDNLDELFGSITFLVDTIHDAIVDFNEDAEAANNSRELGAIIFEALPIIETLPFDQVSQYIDTLFEQIIEVFDSQWDTTPITGTRDRIRCALFCIARDNDNSLTWQLIQDYFYGLTGFTWSQTFNIMLEFANFLQTGTWTGEEVVDIAFGNFAAAMSGMGKFGEMLFPSLGALMRLGQNDPDPDWETLCEDCTFTWERVFDFTVDEDGWAVSPGAWIDGTGFQSLGSGPNPYTVQVTLDITWPGGSELTRILVGATSTTADASAFRGVYYPPAFDPQTGYTTNTGDYVMNFDPNTATPGTIAVQVSNTNAVPGTNTIRFVTLRGTGTEPSW